MCYNQYVETCFKLAQLRKMAKITQDEIANDLGYDRRNISAFERGKINNAVILLYYVERFPEAIEIIGGI